MKHTFHVTKDISRQVAPISGYPRTRRIWRESGVSLWMVAILNTQKVGREYVFINCKRSHVQYVIKLYDSCTLSSFQVFPTRCPVTVLLRLLVMTARVMIVGVWEFG
jgi:hypothetical protein